MAETFYGTGKRKDAIARVWIAEGSGEITVNDKPVDEYFGRLALRQVSRQLLNNIEGANGYNVKAFVKGGGLRGQADALRHGLAKALLASDEELRKPLRELGALTRDPRVKERKKYGRKRARRGFQFSKR